MCYLHSNITSQSKLHKDQNLSPYVSKWGQLVIAGNKKITTTDMPIVIHKARICSFPGTYRSIYQIKCFYDKRMISLHSISFGFLMLNWVRFKIF